MLLLVTLLVSLNAFFGCAASKPSPNPRYVTGVRTPRGLVPRQDIAGVRLDSPNSVPGTGIIPLVLASDHRCAQGYPILRLESSGYNVLARPQFILCNDCCGEHFLSVSARHRVLGYFHRFDRLCVGQLPFNPEIPSEISEPYVRLSQRKYNRVQRKLRRRNLCVPLDRLPGLTFLTCHLTIFFAFRPTPYATDSSGYVARESVRVANLTVPDQAFGKA